MRTYQFDTRYCAYHDRDHTIEVCEHTQTEGAPMSSRILEAWHQLDEQVDEIVSVGQGDPVTDEDSAAWANHLNVLKARARGKAEILALLMPAPFDTADAISMEAGKRQAMRAAGRAYRTPGLPAESAAPGWYHAPGGGFTAEPGQARTS